MGTRRGPAKFRRRITGASAGLTGGGVSAALVQTDGAHLQELVDFIDGRGAFYYSIDLEVPDQVVTSVLEVRKMAGAKKSAVESEEAAEVAQSIETACRVFCRDFNPGRPGHPADDTKLMAAQLDALRRSVSRDMAFAVLAFGLAVPMNLDLSGADVAAKLMLDRWEETP